MVKLTMEGIIETIARMGDKAAWEVLRRQGVSYKQFRQGKLIFAFWQGGIAEQYINYLGVNDYGAKKYSSTTRGVGYTPKTYGRFDWRTKSRGNVPYRQWINARKYAYSRKGSQLTYAEASRRMAKGVK